MKKTIIYSAFILLSFLTACNDAQDKTEEKTENKETIVKDQPTNVADTTRNTTISVGPNGGGVTHKNTEVIVDKNGVEVGTKKVKVVIKK